MSVKAFACFVPKDLLEARRAAAPVSRANMLASSRLARLASVEKSTGLALAYLVNHGYKKI